MVLMDGWYGASPGDPSGNETGVAFQLTCLSGLRDQPKFDPGGHVCGWPRPWLQLIAGAAMRREIDEQFVARTAEAQHNSASATVDRSPMLEISNAMVGLYKEAFGRGPTKARAQFAGPDTLVVILEASLTVAERNLVAMCEHQRLREARLFFTYALEDQFRAIVEDALGRRTVAFVSGIDTDRDVAIEVFTLEPAAEDGSMPREP